MTNFGTGPRFQFTEDKLVTSRKGFYYRSHTSGRRLYFSENEIAKIVPGHGLFYLMTMQGGEYQVQSSVPEYVENEAPYRESVKGDYYFKRT